MTSVNVTEDKYSVSVTEGVTTVVTVKAPGPQGIQGIQGATGAGISAGDKGSLTVAANLTDWTLNKPIDLNDNEQIRFGDSQDLQIFHDSSHSVIKDAGTGMLKILGSTVSIKNVNDNKFSASFSPNTASAFFYNGSKKLETTSLGIDVTGNANISGNLTVSGTTTTIDTTTLTVEDKNIELGKVGSPTDITADGGGITLLGDTNHTFNWLNATDSWTSSEHIALPDNKKLQLGDSQDLQIYHDSSNSYLDNSTGLLFLRNTSTNGSQIQLLSNNSGVKIQGLAGEQSIVALGNGAVELYHDNVKKLETTSSGVTVSGNLFTGHITAAIDGNTSISLQDTGHGFPQSEMKLTNGGRDLNIVAPVDIRLFPQGGENGIVIEGNSSVELYHDNVKRFNTTGDAVDVHGHINLGANTDNKRLRFGINNDLQLYHDGSNSFIDNSFGSLYLRPKAGEDGIIVIPDGAVELYHNNVKKAQTATTGFNVVGTSLKLRNTANNADLIKLFHSGTGGNALFTSEIGDVKIQPNEDGGQVRLFETTSGTTTKRLSTTNNGIDVNGDIRGSSGILFNNDTAAANTLDDYEEGTWTPTVLSEGNIGTPQYTCTYTKIGRLVTINADIHQLSDTTSSSHLLIGGMPYVPTNTSGNWSGACHGERYKGGNNNVIVAFLHYASGSWKIGFRFGVPSGHYANVEHSDISDDGSDNNLRFTLTYELA